MTTLIIHGRLPGCNEYTNACRRNRFAGASMKKKAQQLVLDEIALQLKGVHYEGQISIRWKYYMPNKRMDYDNISFCRKFILDALQIAGVIDNDNWKCIRSFLSEDFFIDKDNPRIEVDIIPVIPFNDFVPNPFDEVKLCEK